MYYSREGKREKGRVAARNPQNKMEIKYWKKVCVRESKLVRKRESELVRVNYVNVVVGVEKILGANWKLSVTELSIIILNTEWIKEKIKNFTF
jgi:hypothetical protein